MVDNYQTPLEQPGNSILLCILNDINIMVKIWVV